MNKQVERGRDAFKNLLCCAFESAHSHLSAYRMKRREENLVQFDWRSFSYVILLCALLLQWLNGTGFGEFVQLLQQWMEMHILFEWKLETIITLLAGTKCSWEIV